MSRPAKFVGGSAHGRVVQINEPVSHLTAMVTDNQRETYALASQFAGPEGELLYAARDVEQCGLNVAIDAFGETYGQLEAYEALVDALPKHPPLSRVDVQRHPDGMRFAWLARY